MKKRRNIGDGWGIHCLQPDGYGRRERIYEAGHRGEGFTMFEAVLTAIVRHSQGCLKIRIARNSKEDWEEANMVRISNATQTTLTNSQEVTE